MQVKRLLILITLLVSMGAKAQNSDIENYINTYRELAISEMQRTGVPASITLAQGIHESMAGKSNLVQRSNNHFGIKCKSSWTGDKVYHDDDKRGECFRSYPAAADSYTDHSDFLRNGARYAFLFNLDPTDYEGWAYGLKKAGYATNSRYSQLLIKIIEDYNLQQYTLIALGRVKPQEEILADNNPVQPQPLPAVSYPEGKFTINRTPVIYARSGASLLAIASQYDVPLRRLLDFNDLKQEDVLIQDQLLFLQRKRKTGEKEFHDVKQGETLYDICQSEGIRLESLLEYNHLQQHQAPAAGEKLYLQSAAPASPKLAGERSVPKAVYAANTNVSTHIVQGKETLFSIARKYGATVENIREWNNLQGSEVKAGQELIIYKN